MNESDILCLDAGSSSLKFALYRAAGAGAQPSLVTNGELPAAENAGESLDSVLHRL